MGNKEPLRISVEKAKQRSDKNESVFLDVVDPGSYEETNYHIEGAIRIDPRDIKDDYQKLPYDREVLTYCTWPNEETSASVAHFLRKEGYDAFAIEGGLEAWREAGYAVEKKED